MKTTSNINVEKETSGLLNLRIQIQVRIVSLRSRTLSGKNSISEGYSIATFYSGYRNWENLLTFGDINEATSADFKSPAYSDVPVR